MKQEKVMISRYEDIFSRNMGIISGPEQESLRRSVVALAGVGGVGGLLAERLVRLGVGTLRITDPGTFEETNINRQFAASMRTIGRNKAAEVYDQIKDINPHARISHTETGIRNEADARLLVDGADVVIDEMDFGLFWQSVLLQRAARQLGLYYLFTSAIGFGALVAVFDPKGMTLEEYDMLPRDADLGLIERTAVPLERVAPIFPSYAAAFPPDIIQKILTGEIASPTTSIGVGLASILAANEVMNIILKKREVVSAPRFIYIDLIDLRLVVGSV